MSSRLQRNLELIKFLVSKSRAKRQHLYRSCQNDLIMCIADCCLNAIKGNVTLTDEEQCKLKRYRNLIRTLARKSVPLKDKRELLIQRGGALTTLLLPILALAGTLLAQ